ncbi:MAG: hypothetical protein GX448_00005, partial [Planctomycetes bacterium]|nr:hypothetical protein [Planctomycetota bacterium]
MPGIEHVPLALSVLERWEAVRRLNTGRSQNDNFTMLGVVLLIVLVTLL